MVFLVGLKHLPAVNRFVHSGGLVDRFSPVTFAVDFSYFKKVIERVLKVSNHARAADTISLPELHITMPLPAIFIGWSNTVETQVFEALVSFVQNRPVANTQSLSRPWHPS